MYTQYAIYNQSLSDEELKAEIDALIKFNINEISIFGNHIPIVKTIDNTGSVVKFSTVLDFPYGSSDTKSRNCLVGNVVKSGVSIIYLPIQSRFVVNRRYDKIREDIKTNKSICDEAGVELRYCLEYRVFNHEILAKVCQILKTMDIGIITPSSGMMIDDISDNLIACEYLNKKSGIHCICTGNLWKSDQLTNAINSKVYGIRFMNQSSLNLYNKYI
jgi:deoxyribose-phosphate aldolase